MSRIWMFHLENVLKYATISVSDDNTIYLYNTHKQLLAVIVGDIYVTSTIQLKLNDKEMEILKNKLKELL